MAVSTKGKNYLGKVSMPVKAEKGMEVKSISEMDYSERKEYIQENYLPNILEAQRTFSFYNTGFSYNFDDKDAQKEILEYYQGESDYTEKELSEKTNYRLNGWDIVRVDTDEETNEEYEEELEELSADNTSNGSYLGLVDLNWRAYYDEMYDKYFYVIHPHLGGDIRGNYGEAFILEDDNKDDLFYRFYEGFVSGSLNVYIKLKDALPVKGKNKPSVLLFDSQQDSDVAIFEFYEEGSEINSKIAQQLLNDFESFSGWEGDEFIDEIVDEYNRVKKAKKYMGGGYLDESPKIYVDILGTDTGKWMDLDGMTEGYEVMDAIQEFIDEYNESKGGNAEEYRIADMEGFGQSYFYNEYMGESDFDTLLNSYSAYQDSDYPAELIFEYANDNNLDIEDAIRSMEDNYYGAYDNMSDFAYQMVSEGLYNPSASDVYVTDTDKRLISGEEADSRIDNMNNREIIESSSQGELIYTDKYSEIEDKISEIQDEISSLEDLLSENENDEDYDNIAETITDKESEIEELEEELENLEEEIADEVRQEVYDNFYDETYDRLENDLEDWLSEFGYEDYTEVNFLVIDYDSISDDLVQDYSVYEADNKYYLFINYKGGGTIKSVGQPKDYSYYIVEKDYNKIISGHDSKKEALKEKSKLKKEYKYLNMDVYSRKVLDVDMDIDTNSFNSFAKPETFKYGGKIALRSGIKATDKELWKSSNDLKNILTKSRAGIDKISLDEEKKIKRNLSRVRAENYLKHKTFNLGGMPETSFLPPDKTPEERRIIHNQRLLTASRSIGNVKESVGSAKDWVQKQWEEADFGDGKGKAKFELGGYIKGDEVLFKNNGKISKGTITDELGNGEYAIFSGSGFGLSQSLVNERDIEGYAPAYEKRKIFGIFNDGGQLRRYDSVVYFEQIDDDEEYSKEYLHIQANTEEQAEKIARERFFQEDAQRYFSPFINYVSLWDRGMIENENPEERKEAMHSMKGFYGGAKFKGGGDVEFIKHNGEEIMYSPHFETYYVNDSEFETLEEAKEFIEKGSPVPEWKKDAYRRGLYNDGGQIEPKLNFGDFKETLQEYEIEGGFGKTIEKGFEMYYLPNDSKFLKRKFKHRGKIKAYKEYLELYKSMFEKTSKDYESGGSIESQNKAMLENDAVQIEHHSEELNKVVPKTKKVPAWVIGKTSRINSDLSDVTHYLDGEVKRKGKYSVGGAIYPDLSLRKADVVNDSIVLDEFQIKKMKNTFKIDGIENTKISSSNDAVRILRKIFGKDTINAYEQAFVLYLNKNNKVIGYYHHSSGGIDGTVMDVQMISGMALKSLAKGVIIAHNHPSENTDPSEADKRITTQLKDALKLFNILLLDSIILTDNSFRSFADEGLIFSDGGTLELSTEKAHKVFHLPFESAVYVPSTSNVDEVISASEMEARVEEVQNYLGNLFGGFSSAETMGGFVDSQGKLVNEDIIKVTSFAEKDAFNQNKEDLLNKLAHWSKDWGQEAMGFEFEGDLYYVPANYKKGGQLKPIPQGNKGLPKLPEEVRNQMGYMDSGGFISDYFYYEPIQFNEGGGVGELQVGDVITFMEDEQKVIRPIKEIKDDGMLVIQLSKDEYIEINPELVIEVKRKQTPYDIITKKIGLPDFVAEYLVQRNKKYAVWLADSIKKQELETTEFVLGSESPTGKSEKELLESSMNIGALQNETIFLNNYREKITSIIDWLEFPLTPNQNLNEMSFQFAYDESERWHNQLEAKGGDINYVEPTENKIIKEYPANEQGVEYYWTLIPSSFCKLEADRMGHCGTTRHKALISLRSKTPLKQGYISDSHVTVAFGSDGVFYQVKGKKNQKPAEKYFPFIYDLIITLIDAEKDGEAELRRRIDEEQAEQIKNYNAKLKEYEDSMSNSTKAIDKLEKELENNFDSLDVDEYEQKLEEIELLKNVDSPVRRKLRELDNSHQLKLKQIQDKHLNSRLQFNGFGTEYQSSQDYGLLEMTRNQKVQLFKLKPNVLENVEDMIEFYVEGLITKEEILSKIKDNEDFDKYKIQIKLYDAGLIEQLPNTFIEIEYDANDLSRFFKSDYSDETIYQMITGEDTYSWFDGSWEYYYENATDYIDELNKENQQIIIDYMIENSDLTQEQIQEEGIEYYLKDDDYSEDFDEVKRSLASALTSSEEGAMLNYYYSKIKEALEELGEVVSLNDEGLKMKVELTNLLNEEEISDYEESVGYGDFEGIFKEALYSNIDLPILRIDDRYSDRADLNESFYGVE